MNVQTPASSFRGWQLFGLIAAPILVIRLGTKARKRLHVTGMGSSPRPLPMPISNAYR